MLQTQNSFHLMYVCTTVNYFPFYTLISFRYKCYSLCVHTKVRLKPQLTFLSPFLFGLLISFTLSSLKRLRLSHLLIFYICLCWFKKVLKEKELFKIRQQKKQSCKQTNLYSFVSSKFTKRHHCMYLFFELFAMRYLIGDIVGRYHSGPKLIQN